MTSLKRCEGASPTQQSLTISSKLYHSCFSEQSSILPRLLARLQSLIHTYLSTASVDLDAHGKPKQQRPPRISMPPADVEDAWSDSDDELEADIETAVDLGVPDGPVDDPAALLDPTVSRIGGHPVRCTFAPSCTSRILIYNPSGPATFTFPITR
ncbi:hypothetical protein BD414DRAFT_477645 [Trametes punicea]|nr:hypothetical protein BD414DRAFT_477645 [Trametes punicea]